MSRELCIVVIAILPSRDGRFYFFLPGDHGRFDNMISLHRAVFYANVSGGL